MALKSAGPVNAALLISICGVAAAWYCGANCVKEFRLATPLTAGANAVGMLAGLALATYFLPFTL